MVEILVHPLALARRAQREEGLLAYALLTAEAEKLAQEWGEQVGTCAALQLRLLQILWAGLNNRLGNGWIEADPEWKVLQQRFIAVTQQAQIHHCKPCYREAAALLVLWEQSHGPLLLLWGVAQNLAA